MSGASTKTRKRGTEKEARLNDRRLNTSEEEEEEDNGSPDDYY